LMAHQNQRKPNLRVRLSLVLSKPQAWYGITRQRVWNRRRRMASPKVHFCGLIPYDAPHRFHAVFDGFHATLRVDFILKFFMKYVIISVRHSLMFLSWKTAAWKN